MEITDEMAAAKWAEIAPLIDTVMGRIQDPDDFPIYTNSELAGDDAVSTPYQVSHSARWCLNAGVEHLHALKSLVIDTGRIHSTAPYSLIRGAFENCAAGYWILHPTTRSLRVEHGLRWWAKNFRDQSKAGKTAARPIGKLAQPRLTAIMEIGKAAGCDAEE
ncbi:MAG TPA: hypothetical protein VN609_05515, partial [Propionibacteriaceae bacterium]|nr:hypothetical protein [Propionibacteriaceae bacterium]